jgi:hypothetical protein
MKKLLAFMICAAMTGCMINPPKPSAPVKGSGVVDAQAKLADKLPLVTPESITSDNAATKSRELQAELNREAKNLAAARAESTLPK